MTGMATSPAMAPGGLGIHHRQEFSLLLWSRGAMVHPAPMVLPRPMVHPSLSLVTGPRVHSGPGLLSPTGCPGLKLTWGPLGLTGVPGLGQDHRPMGCLVLVKSDGLSGSRSAPRQTVHLGPKFPDLDMGQGLHDTATMTGDHGIADHHSILGLGPLGGTGLRTGLWTGLGVRLSLAPPRRVVSHEVANGRDAIGPAGLEHPGPLPDGQRVAPASFNGSQGRLFLSLPSVINQYQLMDILAMINVTKGPSFQTRPHQDISVEDWLRFMPGYEDDSQVDAIEWDFQHWQAFFQELVADASPRHSPGSPRSPSLSPQRTSPSQPAQKKSPERAASPVDFISAMQTEEDRSVSDTD